MSGVSFSGSKVGRTQIFEQNQRPLFAKNYNSVSHDERFNSQTRASSPPKNQNAKFNPEQAPKVPCHYHYDQYITNICRHPSCVLPLCPQCVKIHSQEHQQYNTYGEFDSLEGCLSEATQKLNYYINKFNEEILAIQQFQGNTGDGLNEQLEKLRKAKQQVYVTVETFFQTLEDDLAGDIKKNHEFLKNQSTNFLRYLQQRQTSLKNHLDKLFSDKCVKNLLKFYSQNVDHENDLYFQESQKFMNSLNRYSPHIIIEQPGIYDLSLNLSRFISIKKGQVVRTNQVYQMEDLSINKYSNPPKGNHVYNPDYSYLSRHSKEYPLQIQDSNVTPSPIRRDEDIKPVTMQPQGKKEMEDLHPYLRTPPNKQVARDRNQGSVGRFNPYDKSLMAKY